MSHHSHPKHDSHKHDHAHKSSGGDPGSRVKPHVKWGLLIAVALMLIALAAYVFTNDESVQPGKPLEPTVPGGP